MSNDPVHACHYTSQPYMTVLCTQQEHYVYAQPPDLPESVHRADWSRDKPVSADTPLYTFDDAKVNCPACLAKLPAKEKYMNALVQPRRADFWSAYDKEFDTTIYTLEETGDVRAWKAMRFELTCLVFDDPQVAASWLIEARNKHLDLSLATGWQLDYRVLLDRTLETPIVVMVWWSKDDPEWKDWQGPLLDLDVAFLRNYECMKAEGRKGWKT